MLPFFLIDFSKVKNGSKHFQNIDNQHLFVTPKGFEPSTNRTGICHSIQLNYGAG